MGHARSTFSCTLSSPTTQRPRNLYSVVSTCKSHLRQEEMHCQEALFFEVNENPSVSQNCDYASPSKALAIRAIVIGQQIDVVAGDFNGKAWRCSNRDNISTIDEAFADSALRRRALHFCGEHRFQTTGLTSVDSLNHRVQIIIGKYACMVHSPSHAKPSVYVPTIIVAIMKHDTTWISSIGATLNHSMMCMTDEFSSKNVLQLVHTGTKNGILAKS